MSSRPALPTRTNPRLADDATPPYEILVDRRRLGRIHLKVNPGLVGTSNATKPENLGNFDYAHLAAPLPKDLSGSEIHHSQAGHPTPENYFLMRRSSDGMISASGMFKAAFPWATDAQDASERAYLKSLPQTDTQEISGNIWVTEDAALALAKEYEISEWVKALLDNERPIVPSDSASDAEKTFTSPPIYKMSGKRSGQRATSESSIASASLKKRAGRAASPVKASQTPGRPKATPRSRKSKKAATKDAGKTDRATPAADSVADSEADDADPDADYAPDGDATLVGSAPPDGSVRVSVRNDVQDDGAVETTRTTVQVELPAGAPDMALPTDTEAVIEKARQIVADIKDIKSAEAAGAGAARGGKRKAAALDLEGPEEVVEEVVVLANGAAPTALNGDAQLPLAKRTRVMVPAEEYRREKVTRRALVGLSGALAIGAIIPFVSTLF